MLRDGKRIVTRDAEGIDEAEMVRLMVGRQIDRGELVPVAADAPEVLRVEDLSVEDPDRPGGRRVSNVSFTLRRGEILGLAGLIGAGRTDLLLALTGALERPVTGRVRLAGSDYRPSSPAAAKAAGLVLLPEERKSQAIFPDLSVCENVVLPSVERVGARWMDRPRGRPAGRRAAHGRHRRASGLAGRPDLHALRRQPAEGDPRPLPLRLAVDPPPR